MQTTTFSHIEASQWNIKNHWNQSFRYFVRADGLRKNDTITTIHFGRCIFERKAMQYHCGTANQNSGLIECYANLRWTTVEARTIDWVQNRFWWKYVYECRYTTFVLYHWCFTLEIDSSETFWWLDTHYLGRNSWTENTNGPLICYYSKASCHRRATA